MERYLIYKFCKIVLTKIKIDKLKKKLDKMLTCFFFHLVYSFWKYIIYSMCCLLIGLAQMYPSEGCLSEIQSNDSAT